MPSTLSRPEVPRPMTPSPRSRLPTTAQRAGQIAHRRPETPEGYAQTARALLALATEARAAGDAPALRAARQAMAVQRAHWQRTIGAQGAASMRLKRNPTAADPLTLWYAATLGAPVEPLPTTPPPPTPAHERDQLRLGANALAHALWALSQGERTWEALPTRPHTLPVQGGGSPRSSTPGAAVLTVRVPAVGPLPPLRALLYRADYEGLLLDWGYARVQQADRVAARLRVGALGADVDLLLAMALEGERSPNLARAWHAYVTSARLGDVFIPHASGSVQLSPNRSGDLREAVLQLYGRCRVVVAQ